jgi:hypothetical protein
LLKSRPTHHEAPPSAVCSSRPCRLLQQALPCHFALLRLKCLPQCSIIEDPQFLFFPESGWLTP